MEGESRLKASEVSTDHAKYLKKTPKLCRWHKSCRSRCRPKHKPACKQGGLQLSEHLCGDPSWEPQTHPATASLPGGTQTNNSCVPCLVLPSPPTPLGGRKACLKKRKGRGGKPKGHRDGLCISEPACGVILLSLLKTKDFQQIPEKSWPPCMFSICFPHQLNSCFPST